MIMAKRPSRGRQKIEIKRIEDEAARQVTFSKRRAGLFKKASELSILCGAETAVIVFSPAGKVYSFGHPLIETVIDRLLTPGLSPNTGDSSLLTGDLVGAHRAARIHELNREFTELSNQLEAEKKREKMLKKSMNANEQHFSWDSIDKLGLHELETLKAAMEEMKKNVYYKQAYGLNMNSSSPRSILDQKAVRMIDPYNPCYNNATNVSHGYDFLIQRRPF
ncbi:hypothetical protein IFM89_001754 [Coptis chinensis]|uniref:MADS-box domain-containing protein n=1 Tax=Coptis chinensis TaxID=261450 RepID=A0A835HKM1_9MAGN|nr:hypothetical protein IFM89_001754 [Coptis chinensis]